MTSRQRGGRLVIALVLGSAVVSLLFCAGFSYVFFVGIESDRIDMPAMTIDVTDESGAPVPGARVVIEHVIQPHNEVQERTELATDERGRVTTDLVKTTEQIYPLCMHGVPGHQHFVCVAQPGAMPVVMRVETTDAPIAIAVPLRRDPSSTHSCTDDLHSMELSARTRRTDIESADHVSSAQEP